jgi:RNA polymerase sigma factor (sigma-70 family)
MHGAVAVVARTGYGEQPERLAERATRGDQSAWDHPVRQYSPMLWRLARGYRLSEQDAADAVQTTWLRLAEHVHRIRDPSRISNWLTTTVKRECLQPCLRRRTVCLDDTEVAADEAERPDVIVQSADDRRLLLAAFTGYRCGIASCSVR